MKTIASFEDQVLLHNKMRICLEFQFIERQKGRDEFVEMRPFRAGNWSFEYHQFIRERVPNSLTKTPNNCKSLQINCYNRLQSGGYKCGPSIAAQVRIQKEPLNCEHFKARKYIYICPIDFFGILDAQLYSSTNPSSSLLSRLRTPIIPSKSIQIDLLQMVRKGS